MLVFLFIRRVVHSPFGQVLKAIRENEPRAVSLGYEINRYKLLAFVLSATLAGLAVTSHDVTAAMICTHSSVELRDDRNVLVLRHRGRACRRGSRLS